MAAPRSPLILLVFLQASKVKLMGVLGDMCYVAYHFLEACNVQALYLSTSPSQAHSDDSTHLEYLPLDIKDAWREATAIRDNVGGFTPEGGPQQADMFTSMLKEGEYPWMNRDASDHAYGVLLHTHKDGVSRALEEQELILEELKGCQQAFHVEIGQVQAELDSLQVHIDTLNANRDVMKSPAHVETLTCPYERVVILEIAFGPMSAVSVSLLLNTPQTCRCSPAATAEYSWMAWEFAVLVKDYERSISRAMCRRRLLEEKRCELVALHSKATGCLESLSDGPGEASRYIETEYNEEYAFAYVSDSDED